MSALKGLLLAAAIGFTIGWLLGLDLARLNEVTGAIPDVVVLSCLMGVVVAAEAVIGGTVLGTLLWFAMRRRWSIVPCTAAGGLAGVLWLDLISRDYGAHQWFDLRNASLSHPFGESLLRAVGWLLLSLVVSWALVALARRLPARLRPRAALSLGSIVAVLTLWNSVVPQRVGRVEAAPYVQGPRPQSLRVHG